jgi:hypothetical protein
VNHLRHQGARSVLPGNHTVTATGQSFGLMASASFLIQATWKNCHFDLANRGFNPDENVLNKTDVRGPAVRHDPSPSSGPRLGRHPIGPSTRRDALIGD